MNRITQLMGFVLGGALAFVVLQGVSGCADGRGLVVSTLDQGGFQQLQRFDSAYDTYVNDPANSRQREHFRDVYRFLRANYVIAVDDAKLIDDALIGIEEMDPAPRAGGVAPDVLVEAALDKMLASLDPHSSYLNPDELKESMIITRGEFGGLGIEVIMEDGLIKVVSPIEDTPAYKAGIQAGDLITHLDGEEIKGKTLSQAVKIMRGRPGTAIHITVSRADLAPFEVRIVRDIIQVRSVKWRLEGDYAYIRLVSFTAKVEPRLEQTFAELADIPGLKGIVLDLRNNPGGLLDQSVFVADAFLESGQVVAVRERDPKRDRIYMARPGDLGQGLPLVVLINEGSASASEIVAGALKDHGRATIMGRRSFGKGSVQTIQPMTVEGAVRITTALYYMPSGHTIQARGVAPDVILSLPEPENGEEAPHIRREADLPGAFNGDAVADAQALARLPLENCPAAGPEGKDLELGCALMYLSKGSATAFEDALRN
ncbi:S41 family peptidase [Pseudomonadota bacterium]